jgi:transcription initiation factor TFIIB
MVLGIDRDLSTKQCGRCNALLVTTDHEIVCSKCGVVWAERFSDDTWDYDIGERGSGRTGPPENPMMVSSTVIAPGNKDAAGRYLKGEAKDMVKRITIWDKRQKSNGKRTLNIANTEITRLCQVLGISENIKQRGAEIFRECEKYKMMRGRTTTVFSAACLYAASREAGTSKTLTDFTNACYARRSDISAYYRLIIKTLDIKPDIMSPVSYISRIGSNTIPQINVKTQHKAIKLLNELDNKEGKDPVGLAAAALYYCCCLKGWDYTQRTIAIAAGITEVTIRNRIKDMLKQLKDSDSSEFRSK